MPKGKGGFVGFWPQLVSIAYLFNRKCIRLVREKLIIFPYGQYIVGI